MATPRRVVISLVAVKGGAGKSTVAIALACEWHRRGRKVLGVDIDKQQRSLRKWADLRDELGVDGPEVISLGDNLEADFARRTRGYDLVIIDTPGKLGTLPVVALGLSHVVIMPCGPNGIEVASMQETFEQVSTVRALRKGLAAFVLITKMQVGTVVARRAHKAYEDKPFDTLETQLHYRLDYGQSHDAGLGPTTWRPESDAAVEISKLVDELDQRVIPARFPALKLVRSATHGH